ncbi:MAG: hypothetical protein ACI4MK_02830 [Aristaeellaceae bacterium]
MGYERKLTAGEAELLRRAGTYFGRERLLADHVLPGRVLGDLLPDERDARRLCDTLMERPDGAALLARLLDGASVTLPVGTPEDGALLAQIMAAFFGRTMAQPVPAPAVPAGPVQEIRRDGTVPGTPPRPSAPTPAVSRSAPPVVPPPPKGEPVTLAELPSATIKEITGANHKDIHGRVVVTTEGLMMFRRSAASSAGAAVVGVMTLGLGAKSMLRNASTAMQPSILLPVQDIHAIVRQYVPTIHDLVFHMRNGRRFRLSCSIMEAQQDEVEAIAIAIEELQAKQGGNR